MKYLVFAETNPLTKAIAGTLPFESFTVILLHRQLTAAHLSGMADPKEVERLTNLLDRAVKRKQRAEDLLLKKEASSCGGATWGLWDTVPRS